MQIEPRQLEQALTTLRAALDDGYNGKWFITEIADKYDGSVMVTAAYLLPCDRDDSVLDTITNTRWSHIKVTANIGDPTVVVDDDFPVVLSP